MKRKLISIMAACMVVTMMTACGNAQQAALQPETESVQEATEMTVSESTETVEATVESTVEETKEAQPETQPEETKEVAAESTETVAATPAPEEAATTYTYTDMDKTMYAQKSVNVRDLPTTDGQKLGALALNQEVKVTGQCVETAWYRIVYNDGAAYVSDKYLGDAKVEESAQTAGTVASTATSVNGMSRTASDYRSISSLSELSEGTPWSVDFNAFSDNYKSIEKVTYTHNGVTVLLYNYLMHDEYRDEVILYDFTRKNFCWCRVGMNELDSIIDAGGIASKSVKGEDRFQSIADYQVY